MLNALHHVLGSRTKVAPAKSSLARKSRRRRSRLWFEQLEARQLLTIDLDLVRDINTSTASVSKGSDP